MIIFFFFLNHEHLSLEGASARSIGVRGRGTLDEANAMRHGKFLVVRERRKSLGEPMNRVTLTSKSSQVLSTEGCSRTLSL